MIPTDIVKVIFDEISSLQKAEDVREYAFDQVIKKFSRL